jgi:hypothetical protein
MVARRLPRSQAKPSTICVPAWPPHHAFPLKPSHHHARQLLPPLPVVQPVDDGAGNLLPHRSHELHAQRQARRRRHCEHQLTRPAAACTARTPRRDAAGLVGLGCAAARRGGTPLPGGGRCAVQIPCSPSCPAHAAAAQASARFPVHSVFPFLLVTPRTSTTCYDGAPPTKFARWRGQRADWPICHIDRPPPNAPGSALRCALALFA